MTLFGRNPLERKCPIIVTACDVVWAGCVRGDIQNAANNMRQLAVCFGTENCLFPQPVCTWPDQLSYHTFRANRCVLLEDNHGSIAQTFPSVIEAAGFCVSTIAGGAIATMLTSFRKHG